MSPARRAHRSPATSTSTRLGSSSGSIAWPSSRAASASAAARGIALPSEQSGPGADGGLEGDALRRAVGGGRDGLGVDRSGLRPDHAAAARGRLRGDRERRARGAAAPGAAACWMPTAASSQGRRPEMRSTVPVSEKNLALVRDALDRRGRGAARHRRARPRARDARGGQDRHRAGRAPASTPRTSKRTRSRSSTATTPGSWLSRRPTRREIVVAVLVEHGGHGGSAAAPDRAARARALVREAGLRPRSWPR